MKIQKFTRTLVAAGIAALTLGAVGCMEWPKETTKSTVISRAAVDGIPHVTATKKTSGEAKIAAVDFDKRTVDLLDADGKVQKFNVPQYVVNFPQIKKGDLVKVDYTETLEANLRKAGTELKVTEAGIIATAPKGDKPGLLAVRTVETLCNVQSIDYPKHQITLVGVKDTPVTFKVSELLPGFENIKVGDQVIFTFTESLIINVTGK
jgi:hypothetical protein